MRYIKMVTMSFTHWDSQAWRMSGEIHNIQICAETAYM